MGDNILKKKNSKKKEKKIQEEQYEFPYHHIPKLEKGKLEPYRNGTWAYHYFAKIKLVKDQLEKVTFKSLVDIGCGDGRVLKELQRDYPDKELIGIDYSERAIQHAQILNPNLNFISANIIEKDLSLKVDIAIMIAVLEHIDPENVDLFLERTRSLIKKDGILLITVPHENNPLSKKHFQHFTKEKLDNYLEPYFTNMTYIPFNVKSKVISFLYFLLGGGMNFYLIKIPQLWYLFYQYYIDNYLYANESDNYYNICCICRKK